MILTYDPDQEMFVCGRLTFCAGAIGRLFGHRDRIRLKLFRHRVEGSHRCITFLERDFAVLRIGHREYGFHKEVDDIMKKIPNSFYVKRMPL